MHNGPMRCVRAGGLAHRMFAVLTGKRTEQCAFCFCGRVSFSLLRVKKFTFSRSAVLLQSCLSITLIAKTKRSQRADATLRGRPVGTAHSVDIIDTAGAVDMSTAIQAAPNVWYQAEPCADDLRLSRTGTGVPRGARPAVHGLRSPQFHASKRRVRATHAMAPPVARQTARSVRSAS